MQAGIYGVWRRDTKETGLLSHFLYRFKGEEMNTFLIFILRLFMHYCQRLSLLRYKWLSGSLGLYWVSLLQLFCIKIRFLCF